MISHGALKPCAALYDAREFLEGAKVLAPNFIRCHVWLKTRWILEFDHHVTQRLVFPYSDVLLITFGELPHERDDGSVTVDCG